MKEIAKKKATGPRTKKGKAVSSRNATKHGLLSQEVLIPGENTKDLEYFSKSIFGSLNPSDEMQKLLVEKIVSAMWRLRRVLKFESTLFQTEHALEKSATGEEISILQGIFLEKIHTLSRYESTIERGLYKALEELQRLQSQVNNSSFSSKFLINVAPYREEEFVS
jgi:hypothetical protein